MNKLLRIGLRIASHFVKDLLTLLLWAHRKILCLPLQLASLV